MNEANLPTHNDAELHTAMQRQLDDIMAGDPNRIMHMLAPSLMDVNFGEREVLLRYGVSPWMLNMSGILHGGILATMIDNSMGVFSRAFTGKSILTLNLQVSYAAAVRPENEWVQIRCRITTLTNRFAHLYAAASTEEGGPTASSTGIVFLK